MKRVFKAHPLMIVGLLKPFLFILIIPVLKGLFQYILYQRVSGIVSFEIVCFAAILAVAILRYRAFRLTLDGKKIIISSGIILVRRAVIQTEMLSSVQTAKNPFDSVFRAVTYRINTESGQKGRTDFEFKLSERDSHEVSRLLYGEESRTAVKFSIVKLAVMAATTSSAVTGLIISVPVVNKAGSLLGLALNKMVLDEINTVSEKFNFYFPPIVNVITLVFLFGYLAAFLYSLFKYLNFKLFLEKDKLEVESGFIIRRKTAFRKSAVNDVRIEQTPLMRLFRRFSMKVSVGGYGDSKRESAVIVPCGRHGEIKRQFSLYFPFLSPDGISVHATRSRKSKQRFLYLPKLYGLLTMGAALTGMLIFEYFERLILFLAFVLLAVILYYGDLCLYDYRFSKVRFGENNVYARSSKGVHSCELCCSKGNIGQIKLIRYPFDVKQNTCKVIITVRSESADSIRVRHLPYDTVKSEVYKCFNITE